MLDFIIKRVLAWLAGITADQWTEALGWVVSVEQHLATKSGAEKKAAVVRQLKHQFPKLTGSALNLLIEAAVAYMAKRNATA